MASKKDTQPIDVSWEDQRNICTFSRMHQRFAALQAMIKARQKNMEDISDASDEVFISDSLHFVFGEAFVEIDSSEAEELLTVKKEKEEKELADLHKEFDALEKSMTDLKAQLYAKFGSQIYLENQ